MLLPHLCSSFVALLGKAAWIGVGALALSGTAWAGETFDRPNLLVIVADDVGVDIVGAYGEHPQPALTPNIDRLASDGVLFRTVWANPKCSPTRATILTGRYAFRTGIGEVLSFSPTPGVAPEFGLTPDQITLPRLLAERGYNSGAMGKWHLATNESLEQGFRHAAYSGFQLHAGTMQNAGYFIWQKNVATKSMDSQIFETGYSPSSNVDDTLNYIDRMGDDPWFIWLAFNSAHSPWHQPPDDLLSAATLAGIPPVVNPPILYRAMVEAMDSEIGRLLASLAPGVRERTIVVVMGDNGTPGPAVTLPSTLPAKGSLREGGLRVPLIMSGPGIASPGREVTALVNSTDLHATLLELAGARPAEGTDSNSLVPHLLDPHAAARRHQIYAERFRPNGFSNYTLHGRTIRSARFKLVRNELTGGAQFYNIAQDPDQQLNLIGMGMPALSPVEQAAFDELELALAAHVTNVPGPRQR